MYDVKNIAFPERSPHFLHVQQHNQAHIKPQTERLHGPIPQPPIFQFVHAPAPHSMTSPFSNKSKFSDARGSCTLSGIAICEAERLFKKDYYKLFDAQLFIKDDPVNGDGTLAALRFYDETKSQPSPSTRAYFITASVSC